jgi:enamine deaminase RidA (YjgF/YER057c/UK114 family)
MAERNNISSDAEWEDIVGYSRAVRIGNLVEVSGTTAVDGEKILDNLDAYGQTKFILQKIEKALKEAGASMINVIRTRMYVTDISKWDEMGRAHGEYFKDIKPASTMVEVKALISPGLLIEIEATAIIN